ncbi:MAG: acyl-CoA thioesterase [Clostridiales bacterium]|nr:acyl-CoA thioesterase [Clostridiales bacterium]
MKPYCREVYYYETDQMGIVHHSNYVRWLEETRLDFLRQEGLSYHAMEETGILIPVLGVSVSYKIPFRYGDSFAVTASLYEYNGIRMKIAYDIRKEGEEEIYARGQSEHCFCGRDMKPISLKRSFPELYEKFRGLLAE